MPKGHQDSNPAFLGLVGLCAWIVPGGGYYLLGDKRRALLVCVTLVLTFGLGLYIGSVGVIDPVHAKPWYLAQIMNSPAVMLIGHYVARTEAYPVFGRPNEIGQIYTSIAGLLNLLCLINAVYLAHTRQTTPQEVNSR